MRSRKNFGGVAAVLVVVAVSLIGAGVSAAQTETVLFNFNHANNEGASPWGNLIFDASGNLYGTTASGPGTFDARGTVFELTPAAGGGWTENVLYSFDGASDGLQPFGGLIFDSAGNLYGTTMTGGSNFCNGGSPSGCGTVFELTSHAGAGWTEKILYNFSQNKGDGYFPRAGLVLDAAGNLYGTTQLGGTGDCVTSLQDSGCGTVFELMPQEDGIWTEKILHEFQNNGSDGILPWSGVILDASGNVYGTTQWGGAVGSNGRSWDGTVYELTPSADGHWKETILHNFGDGEKGKILMGGLIFDAAGNLYGTAYEGGSHASGTVFKLTRKSGGDWHETVVHTFLGFPTDGLGPQASLVFDRAGNLYGTTTYAGDGGRCPEGGGVGGCGIVFELAPSADGIWTETVLHNFTRLPTDGYGPVASLVLDSSGNLYGTTASGGRYYGGVVFEIAP